ARMRPIRSVPAAYSVELPKAREHALDRRRRDGHGQTTYLPQGDDGSPRVTLAERLPGVCAGFAPSSEPEGIRWTRAGPDHDALRLQVQIERLQPELAAEAGLLVATEGNAGKSRVRHVDPHRARLDL